MALKLAVGNTANFKEICSDSEIISFRSRLLADPDTGQELPSEKLEYLALYVEYDMRFRPSPRGLYLLQSLRQTYRSLW